MLVRLRERRFAPHLLDHLGLPSAAPSFRAPPDPPCEWSHELLFDLPRPRPWQATREVLARFGLTPRQARAAYCGFVAAGVAAGHRPELRGGGLVRSAGGWAAVRELRRGREGYSADERVLGGSDFVATLLRERERAEAHRARARRKDPDLPSLIAKLCRLTHLTPEALAGSGRRADVCRAREGLAYLWVEVLGRSGRQLAYELHLRPESVYKAARRGRNAEERWREVLEV